MVSYTYDAEGRATEIRSRTQAGALTTRTLRYQGNAPAQELVSGSVVREYVTDEAGSIVKVCDPTCASGTVYVVVWNGHGDATGLWTVDANTGTLTLANTLPRFVWTVRLAPLVDESTTWSLVASHNSQYGHPGGPGEWVGNLRETVGLGSRHSAN